MEKTKQQKRREKAAKKRLLILESYDACRFLYEEEFARLGFDVIATGDEAKAEKLLETEEPDAVLLDGSLPENGALKFLVRSASGKKAPKVVFNGFMRKAKRYLYWAVDDYCKKSTNTEELTETVRRLLETSHQNRIR